MVDKDIQPLPGASSWSQLNGAALAPPAAAATGAAGIGRRPVQSPVHRSPSTMLNPPGAKRDHISIWQSEMCLRIRSALYTIAPIPRGQEPQRMPQGPSGFSVPFMDSFTLHLKIFTYFLRGVVEHNIINSWNIH